MLKKLTKSIRRRKRNSTALTEVLHSLCLYHKQQIRLMLQFLTAERRLCSNVCRKTKESVTFQDATRDRFTTRDRLKRPASSPHLPPVSVCLEDLRLTCPNLTFGSIHLDSKKCGFEQLKSSNLVTINSKGKRHSCLVAANGTDAQPPKKRKRRTRLSSSLSDHDSRCSQDATIEQHKDSKNNVAFSSISNNSEKNSLLDVKDSLLQDFLSFVNQKVNGKIPVAQPKSHTRNLRSTEKQSIDRVKFRKLVKCILNKTVQNGCSFKEALNRYVKNLEGDSMQTRFRKRKKTMPEFESPPSSLTRREVLQIKSELCSLMESLAKETKEAAKKSTRKPRTNKKVISNKEQVHDVLVMANCGNVHREDSFQKDVTELPQNNLKVDSKSVNCSKEIGLPKHLALAPKQKVTCAERSPRCHIGPKNPKDCTTSKYSYSDKSGKYKNGCRLQGDCFAQGASNCFCKCTSRQISKIFKGKVYGFPDLLKNDISRKPHLKVIVERLKDSVFSANQQFSQPAPHNGKLNTYDLKRKRNPTVSHCCNASQSLGKPLNHVRKRTHLNVNRRNDNIGVPCGDRVAGAKRNQSTKVSTEQSMPSIPNRLCSPVKIMFLSNVDGAEGIKYSLSSVYVSGHEKSSEKPAESRNDRQDTCTTVLSEKSIDKRGTAPESKTSSHGWKESRTSEDACDKGDFYEKRPRRMPKRVAPLVLKQIRNPIGASPKIQIKKNAEKCEEPKRNFTVCKRNVDNEHSGITLSIKFGSSTMRRCISRVNAPHFKGILCKKASLPPSKINILPIGKRNSDKTRDSPNSAGKASICNFEYRRTTRSNSARLQNPQELSMCKKSVTVKCHKTPEKRLPLSNTLPCFLQKRIDPEQAVKWKANKTNQQTQRKPFNTRSLRSSVSRNCKLSSQATLSTSLNPMPSTLNALRRNSKRCSLNKHKLTNERCENMDEVCEPPTGNAEGLKSVINVLDSSASSIFQPNNVLKWWSSSSSKESLLQDLNHRYEQITNTWQKETDNEKSSSLQRSGANRSFVQMMFDKKYDDKDISVWLMQTTETKSLSILPKANARQPSEENHHFGVKTRKKRTKKSKRRVRRLNKLRCRRVWNLNHIESTEDQSKDICLKFVCTRKILAVTVPEKCTLRKDVFESPTSSPPDSQAVAKGSALNCSNATTRVPRKKTGKLLDNEPMTTQTRCYANKPTINVKGCKAFISKPGGVEGKAPKENGSFLKPLHPRNSTEQNKCTLRSNHNFTVDFRTKRNKGRHWSLTKTLSTTLNSKNSELGKRSGLRKSRRTAITNPSVTWILERKMKRKRHGMVVSTCGEISPKKSKVPLTTRKEDVEYSKMKLGPLKPIGLPSPRGLSNKGGMYSLAPIRISHHGTNTKA